MVIFVLKKKVETMTLFNFWSGIIVGGWLMAGVCENLRLFWSCIALFGLYCGVFALTQMYKRFEGKV